MKTAPKTIIIFALSFIIGLNYSCKKDQAELDREIIEQYISDNSLDAVELNSTGLFYVIEDIGNDTLPTAASEVTVNYKGKLTNGTVFDSNYSSSFSLSSVIQGWQLGIPLIGEGGTIKLLIPSDLGYGSNSTGKIPSDAVLIFDVDLISVN